MTLWIGAEPFCEYATIGEAVEELERRDPRIRETLYILPGTYREQIEIHRSNLNMIGVGEVNIEMNRHAREKGTDGEEIGTFATPTLFLGGSNLRVENIIVSNTAGQGEHIGQAVAVTAYCDRTVFRSCTFKGYQDTLFTGPLPPAPKERSAFGGIEIRQHHEQYRQLYMNCRIEGTVDYIFGGACAYFEHCELHSLARPARPDRKLIGYVTAASTPENQSFGYVFRNCVLTAAPDVASASVYLGRPWRAYAQTVFSDCRIGSHIHPAGWDHWGNVANELTVDYREYGSIAETDVGERVHWAIQDAMPSHTWSKRHVFGEKPFW